MRIKPNMIVKGAAVFLAIVFLSSASLKALYPAEFVKFISAATSAAYVNSLLATVLMAELVIAIMLLYKRFRLFGFFFSTAYILTGTLWYGVMRMQGFMGGCGCFGGQGGSGQLMFVRNGALFILASASFVLLLKHQTKKENDYENE